MVNGKIEKRNSLQKTLTLLRKSKTLPNNNISVSKLPNDHRCKMIDCVDTDGIEMIKTLPITSPLRKFRIIQMEDINFSYKLSIKLHKSIELEDIDIVFENNIISVIICRTLERKFGSCYITYYYTFLMYDDMLLDNLTKTIVNGILYIDIPKVIVVDDWIGRDTSVGLLLN